MKLTLYAATSIDGFIADQDGDSDWVSDVDAKYFDKAIEKAGCVIMGRKTFQQFKGDLYPISGVDNIVITSDYNRQKEEDDLLILNEDPKDLLRAVEKRGHDQAILAGGGTANASFLKYKLIDEMIISVHPLILGKGIKLFELDDDVHYELSEIETKELSDGLVQIRYRVNY